jgi:hypothetical protein
MAGLGARLFPAFSKLTSAQVNGYLMDQTIMRFASTAARDAAFGGSGEPTLAEGMTCYLDDTNMLQSYNGTAWIDIASSTERNGLWRVSPTTVAGTGVTLNTNGTVSFTGSSTVSLNGCFTSKYTNYKIIIDSGTASSGGTEIRLRGRSAGSDTLGSAYYFSGLGYTSVGGTSNVAANGGSGWSISNFSNVTNENTVIIDMMQPNSGKVPSYAYNTMFQGGGFYVWRTGGGTHFTNVFWDGFTIFPAAGTISGLITVYGYGL